jgi:carbonic anhydrase
MHSRAVRIFAFVAVSIASAAASFGQPWNQDPGSDIGPEMWGELTPAFRTCGSEIPGFAGFQETGKRQSPIDISSTVRTKLPNLMFFYLDNAFEVENNNHTVEIPYATGSELRGGGEVFTLRQFHFHAPSEHTIDGHYYPMELHLVHTDSLGNNAVVGVLLEIGDDPNELIEEIFANVPDEEGTADVGGTLNAEDLLPGSLGYYSYAGSLTTPPCTEGVRWFVLRRPVQVSEETVARLHEVIGDFPDYDGFDRNNRPVRPLNGRVILEKR